MGQRKRTPRKPKARSQHRRGGDRVSVKAKTAQMARDAEAYRMRAQGYSFAVIARFLGVGEEAARASYWRSVRSQSLATIEEARGLALSDIEQRRALAWTEIRKIQSALGADGKKRFDVSELRMLDGVLNDCARRQAALMGLDSPTRFAVGWAAMMPSDDLLTERQLDRLNDLELRQLFDLMSKARNGGSVEAKSHHVRDTLNFPLAATPAPKATPIIMPEPEIDPLVADYRETTTERDRQMARLKELHDVLANRDPLTATGDPVARRTLAGEYNQLAARFGAPFWTEPGEPPEWTSRRG